MKAIPTTATEVGDKEWEAAKEAAEKSPSTYTHVLKKPFDYEVDTYTELHFDFGALTGKDLLAIEDELLSQNRPVIVPALSPSFVSLTCVRACKEKIGEDAFEYMGFKDLLTIKDKARNFLLLAE